MSRHSEYQKAWRHRRGDNKRFSGTPVQDLTGTVVGQLTVKGVVPGIRKHKQFVWDCLCSCGGTIQVVTTRLVHKTTQSCGCLGARKKQQSPNWKGVGEMSAVRWHVMKNKAKKRGLDFTITQAYCWKLFEKQRGKCALSGVDISLGTCKEDYGTASLDRIDSTKGYITGNVQWVHRVVNYMKQTLTDAELVNWCRRIVNHNSI